MYRGVDDEERLRIYNTTDKPVDFEVSLKGKLYRLVNVSAQVLGYKPKKGDHFFRLVTDEERNALAEIRLAALRKAQRKMGRDIGNTAKVRATLRVEYGGQLMVVRQD